MNYNAPAAFIDDLFDKYYERLRVYCIGYIGNDRTRMHIVEECIQDVFFAAYKNYTTVASHPNIEAWLLKACAFRLNTKSKRQKKKAMQEAFSLDADDIHEVFQGRADANSIDKWIGANDNETLINNIFDHLNDSDRKLLFDYYLREIDLQELASSRNTTIGTIKVALSRAKRRAKDFCSTNGFFVLLLLTFCIFGIFDK